MIGEKYTSNPTMFRIGEKITSNPTTFKIGEEKHLKSNSIFTRITEIICPPIACNIYAQIWILKENHKSVCAPLSE